ncbi:MAG: PTS transporter subunit EIIC, partial [Mycoplasmataceae bacterium]|nr:PTS transporter subunit EIIC [Mycoplasmataceae bacterium]
MSKKNIQHFGEVSHAKIKQKGGFQEIIAKLSRGLMLPIAMLPIAGLFLGIGSTIVNTAGDNNALKIFGSVLQVPGGAIFSALPCLFAIAIAISFTKDSGTAGLSAFVGWLIFNSIQVAFIVNPTDTDMYYHFLWYKFDPQMFSSIFTTNVGIPSLQTSVFGGIVVGIVVAVLYNKFRNIQLPTIIGFFSGVRFIPIITFISMLVVGVLFSMVWPLIGMGIYKFGSLLGGTPYGFNSFVFGFFERALVPFGLHHAFYAPLWYTAAGGQFILDSNVIYNGHFYDVKWIDLLQQQYGANKDFGSTTGDQNLWMFVSNYLCGLRNLPEGCPQITLYNYHEFWNPNGDVSGNPGQYMQGKYPFMMFGLPIAAVAMILVVPKGSENRKQAFAIIGSSAITSFLTGITEPLEFTFLFLAPWLFWGIHAPLAGISFWLMNVLGAHMGMTFSGGALDFIVYGILPDATGHVANCYWAIVVGAALMPIYYLLFRTLIVRFDVKTPGRDTAVKLFTKADYKAAKGSALSTAPTVGEVSKTQSSSTVVSHKGKYEELADKVIIAYGGPTNIKNVDACITKLRVQVADQSKVSRDELMKLGARGVIKPSPQSVYAVFGNEADIIKNKMNEIL